jgi:type IV pilus assembly protein PilV
MKTSINQVFSRNIQHGFTLIEVLVAVMVFSFGLLGIAGMMTISVRNNHNGYLRSQANFLAENMVDRMRANPVGLWNSAYNGTAAIGTAGCTLTIPCNYNQLALYDTQNWAQSLSTHLPSGSGTINCVPVGAVSTAVAANPPSIWTPVSVFDGICTITVTWNESNRPEEVIAQTLTLVAQP